MEDVMEELENQKQSTEEAEAKTNFNRRDKITFSLISLENKFDMKLIIEKMNKLVELHKYKK
jgi:hypothetical protein